jgi:hypothetical protein
MDPSSSFDKVPFTIRYKPDNDRSNGFDVATFRPTTAPTCHFLTPQQRQNVRGHHQCRNSLNRQYHDQNGLRFVHNAVQNRISHISFVYHSLTYVSFSKICSEIVIFLKMVKIQSFAHLADKICLRILCAGSRNFRDCPIFGRFSQLRGRF